MIDHVTISAQNYETSLAFYTAVLETLGLKPLYEEKGLVTGFGITRPFFWLSASDSEHVATSGLHLALTCNSKDQVHNFHKAAITAGGKDNGAPGPRPQYHADYYAAFILDPDGNNLEAVFGNK
jgi:catechol 2,3-dioxygenase-like lactoylglutathione lyase family enzyme